MRKTILIIALNIAAFVLASCSDNLENLIKDDVIVLDEQFLNGYVYPLSNTYQAMYSATRSEEISFETDWENRSFVYTYSGAKVDLPWSICAIIEKFRILVCSFTLTLLLYKGMIC